MGLFSTTGQIISFIVMIVGLVGLVYCSKKQKKNRNLQKVAIGLLAVVIIAGVFFMYKSGIFGNNKAAGMIANERKYTRAAAYVFGQTIGEKMDGGSALIITGYPNSKGELSKNTQMIIDSIKKGAGDKLIFKVDCPQIPEYEGMPYDRRPPLREIMLAEEFDKLLQKHPNCNLIVSLIGLPQEDFEDMEIFKQPIEQRRKMAFFLGNIYFFFSDILDGTIIACLTHKPGVKYGDSDGEPIPAPDDKQKAFEKRYMIITPDNVEKMQDEYKLFE